MLTDDLAEHWDIVREHFQPQQTFTKAQFVQVLTKADVSRPTAYRRFNRFQDFGLIIPTGTAGTYGFRGIVRHKEEVINNKEDNSLTSDETAVDR
jgi:hypothetical protein